MNDVLRAFLKALALMAGALAVPAAFLTFGYVFGLAAAVVALVVTLVGVFTWMFWITEH